MKIEIETPAYNDRRYGKPYIAKVNLLDKDSKPQWGDWIGSYAGAKGILTVDASPGDVLMEGQKDNRGASYKSAPDYHVVNADGTLTKMDKATAYKYQQQHQEMETDIPVPEPLPGLRNERLTRSVEMLLEFCRPQMEAVMASNIATDEEKAMLRGQLEYFETALTTP